MDAGNQIGDVTDSDAIVADMGCDNVCRQRNQGFTIFRHNGPFKPVIFHSLDGNAMSLASKAGFGNMAIYQQKVEAWR
jgi:hypothetical protein